ncbi:uncharacterized protein LOC134713972 [Mytilus trossulus]|uniref:uncharacterized protein LOC134713972 n=1 Tax=Mytilus trossulus TaxID=6551 RepID=UPI0030066DDC
MGASFAKLNCCGKIRNNKIGIVQSSIEIIKRTETRPSPEILQELQSVGIISERSGGMSFIVETLTENEMIKPRRLPAISVSKVSPRRLADKSRASTSKEIGSIYDNADKELMVEIRRMETLADKGKMAKKSERRRQAAKERRDNRNI